MHLYALIALSVTASAFHVPLLARDDTCDDSVADTESPFDDGPINSNVDATAGIGAEFESPGLFFRRDKQCSEDEDNTFELKGKTVIGRTGTETPPHWRLTGDTTENRGKLFAEYITDGKVVKVGSGDAVAAANSIVNDLEQAWKPRNGGTVKIDTDNRADVCGAWTIFGIGRPGIAGIPWSPQITTPMPLEGLYSLMKENKQDLDVTNVLDGFNANFLDGLVLVTQDHFQSNTNGIDPSTVTDDVLAFRTLVLSYAKNAFDINLTPGQSPKLFTSFMPRTEFNTLFQQVQGKMPGDLSALFKSLACYQAEWDSNKKVFVVTVDPKFCTGPKENPTPIGTVFGDLKFSGTKDHVVFTVNIQAWIEGIGAQSPSPDLLTTFENNAKDGSIGGLGSTTEKMFNSQRSVPLFEFRNLKGLRTSEIVGFMTEVDQSIQQLHKDYAIPPGGTTTDRKRRRQDSDGSACTSPIANPSSTPVPHCDTTADPSDVPYNVFYGSPMGSTDVFGNFCKAVDAATTQPLEWTTDASGNQKTSPSRLMRRTPPPNPSSHSDSKFALSWSPSSSGETCISNCYDAFVEINNSPCGHQGRQSNLLSKSASLDVACGTYSYTVTTGPARCEIGPVDEDDICAGTDCPSGTSAHCVPNEGPNAGICQCF